MNKTAQEIGNNLYAFYDQVARCRGICSDRQDLCSMISNLPGTWPRIIYRVSPVIAQHGSTHALFEKVQAGQYPEVLIATGENIRQTDPFLRSKGFFPFRGWKGMAREYAAGFTAPNLPEEVQIVSLQHPEDREQWARIVSTELIAPTRFDPALAESLMEKPGVDFFLLKYKGVGISTILVYESEGSTGLYMIATDQSARRKGFAHLLVQQIVWQVSQKSQKPLILHATPKGEGLYAKSGFVPFSQFFLYRYLNPQP